MKVRTQFTSKHTHTCAHNHTHTSEETRQIFGHTKWKSPSFWPGGSLCGSEWTGRTRDPERFAFQTQEWCHGLCPRPAGYSAVTHFLFTRITSEQQVPDRYFSTLADIDVAHTPNVTPSRRPDSRQRSAPATWPNTITSLLEKVIIWKMTGNTPRLLLTASLNRTRLCWSTDGGHQTAFLFFRVRPTETDTVISLPSHGTA